MAKIYLKRVESNGLCGECFFNSNLRCKRNEKLSEEQKRKEGFCGSDIYIQVPAPEEVGE